MAIYYVKSTATGTADGLSWANAFLTLGAAAAVDVAGDTIYVSQSHAETAAATVTWAFAGTQINPVRIICANDSAEPPTSVATTALFTTTATATQNMQGGVYCFGLNFECNNTLALHQNGGFGGVYENCGFYITPSTSARFLLIGSNAGTNAGKTSLINCGLRFSHAGQGIYAGAMDIVIKGLTIDPSSAALTSLVPTWGPGRSSGDVLIEGCDLSYMGSSASIGPTSTASPNTMTIRNCRLPAGWSGSLYAAAPTVLGTKMQMYNCDSGDTNYRLYTQNMAAAVFSETTIVRVGGASDGTTALSWKMASTANASYPATPSNSPEIVVWNDTTGAAKTVTVEVLTDGVTLTDADCWLDVQYLGTAGYPLGSFITDAKTDVLATATTQDSSTEVWTTTGLTTPVKQKLSVTITPQEKGFIHAKVMLAKPSTTVYVCPKASVS